MQTSVESGCVRVHRWQHSAATGARSTMSMASLPPQGEQAGLRWCRVCTGKDVHDKALWEGAVSP